MPRDKTPETDVDSEVRAALARELSGDRFGAVRELEEILRQNPDYTGAMGHLAWIRYRQGNIPETLRLLKRILNLEPGNLPAAELRFQAAIEVRNLEAAKQALHGLPEGLQEKARITVSRLEAGLRRQVMTGEDSILFDETSPTSLSGNAERVFPILRKLHEKYPSLP